MNNNIKRVYFSFGMLGENSAIASGEIEKNKCEGSFLFLINTKIEKTFNRYMEGNFDSFLPKEQKIREYFCYDSLQEAIKKIKPYKIT